MKKILSIFCATVAFVLTSAAEQAQSAADKKTGIEVEIRAVEAKIAYMEDKQRQNVKIDESMLEDLRRQLSKLRRQLRHIRRDELVAQAANPEAVKEKKSAKSAAEKSALEKNPPRVRTRAERAAAAKSAEASESAAAAKDSGDSQSSESESAGDSVEPIKTRATPPKRDSIWDHMFPF